MQRAQLHAQLRRCEPAAGAPGATQHALCRLNGGTSLHATAAGRNRPPLLAAAAADEKGKFDELVEQEGVRLLIDPAAMMHVLGTKMDYIDEPLK